MKFRLRPWQRVKGAGNAHVLNVHSKALQSQGCSQSFFLPFFFQLDLSPIIYILRSCISSMKHSTFMPFLCQAVAILTRCHADITIDSFFHRR